MTDLIIVINDRKHELENDNMLIENFTFLKQTEDKTS